MLTLSTLDPPSTVRKRGLARANKHYQKLHSITKKLQKAATKLFWFFFDKKTNIPIRSHSYDIFFKKNKFRADLAIIFKVL
jgi:hypothetical protein